MDQCEPGDRSIVAVDGEEVRKETGENRERDKVRHPKDST